MGSGNSFQFFTTFDVEHFYAMDSDETVILLQLVCKDFILERQRVKKLKTRNREKEIHVLNWLNLTHVLF